MDGRFARRDGFDDGLLFETASLMALSRCRGGDLAQHTPYAACSSYCFGAVHGPRPLK
jgi:hypothetical protein